VGVPARWTQKWVLRREREENERAESESVDTNHGRVTDLRRLIGRPRSQMQIRREEETPRATRRRRRWRRGKRCDSQERRRKRATIGNNRRIVIDDDDDDSINDREERSIGCKVRPRIERSLDIRRRMRGCCGGARVEFESESFDRRREFAEESTSYGLRVDCISREPKCLSLATAGTAPRERGTL